MPIHGLVFFLGIHSNNENKILQFYKKNANLAIGIEPETSASETSLFEYIDKLVLIGLELNLFYLPEFPRGEQ